MGRQLPCLRHGSFTRAPNGAPIDPKAVDKRFAKLQGDLGLPRLALHGLRHTHATLLLEEGVDMRTVSERLGHEAVQTMLSIYGHITPKICLNAAARLAAVVDGAGKVLSTVTNR